MLGQKILIVALALAPLLAAPPAFAQSSEQQAALTTPASDVCGKWVGTGKVSGIDPFFFSASVKCSNLTFSEVRSYSPSQHQTLTTPLQVGHLDQETITFVTYHPGATMHLKLGISTGNDGKETLSGSGRVETASGKEMPVTVKMTREE